VRKKGVKIQYAFVFILAFIIISAKWRKIYAGDIKEVLNDSRIRREIAGFKYAGTKKLIQLLSIKPGMTILDIGTGTGQFVYAYAEELKGTGKIFATEIDIECVNYVKAEARRRGFTNIYPVLVKEEGVDEFYGKQKYDIITVFHIGMYDRVSYFKKLREFLTGDERLIIVTGKSCPAFSLSDFTGNFKGLARELSLEPEDSPFYKSLTKPTRELIKQNSKVEPDEVLKDAIVKDFNQMLYDPHFSNSFVNGPVFRKEVTFSLEEIDYASFLLLCVNRGEGLGSIYDGKQIEGFFSNFSFILNKLLVFQKFRQYFFKEKMFNSENRILRTNRDMEKAGYRLEKEDNDSIPFDDILIFRACKSGEKN